MRLWSIHPQYLDPKGLVALWREPLQAIDACLVAVHAEATPWGYAFDPSKFGRALAQALIGVSSVQLAFEWRHLQQELALRSSDTCERNASVAEPICHPLFLEQVGEVASWERGK